MKKSEALFGVARVPLDAIAVFAALFMSFELRVANIDFLPGRQLLDPATTLPQLPYYLTWFALPSILLFLALAAAFHLYALRATMSAWRELGRVVAVTGMWLAILNAWFFLVLQELFFSRALLFYAIVLIIVFAGTLRMILRIVQRAMLRAGIGRLLVVSLGAHPIPLVARDTLQRDRHYAYLGHLQNLDGLRRLTVQRPIDLVIQTDPDPRSGDTLALIDYCRSHHVGYGFLPPVLADVPHQLQVERLGLLPLIRFQPTPLDGWGAVAKRMFDLAVSTLLLIFLSPVFLVIAIGVFLDGGWPIFYVSERVGQHGRRRIGVLKFRSMRKGADQEKELLESFNHRRDGPLFKVKDDPRITRFGRFLRRWSLDELPQLINVFAGQMSLVGPRPHLITEVERYSLEQRRVFAVKPGITGLAQISGRSDLPFEDEVHCDLLYIEEWSLLLDLWIQWRTFFTIVGREGAD
ncbi:sugar transferase [Candidatus Peregrinibacteria bacterium]|nr:sugar transferase [Candidatus Peregrinibacteria bacterium]